MAHKILQKHVKRESQTANRVWERKRMLRSKMYSKGGKQARQKKSVESKRRVHEKQAKQMIRSAGLFNGLLYVYIILRLLTARIRKKDTLSNIDREDKHQKQQQQQ